jgi:Domain of unknown function DUF302
VFFSNFLSPPARRAYASESGMDDLFWKPKSRYTADAVRQSEAIDLPQKALIWKDEAGQVWLSYNDPKYLAKRHGIKACADVINKIETALGNFANPAAMP